MTSNVKMTRRLRLNLFIQRFVLMTDDDAGPSKFCNFTESINITEPHPRTWNSQSWYRHGNSCIWIKARGRERFAKIPLGTFWRMCQESVFEECRRSWLSGLSDVRRSSEPRNTGDWVQRRTGIPILNIDTSTRLVVDGAYSNRYSVFTSAAVAA